MFYKSKPFLFQYRLFQLSRRVSCSKNNNNMSGTSDICLIDNYPNEPVQMFQNLVSRLGENKTLIMNLATIDNEFGVLNRSLIYRGIVDDRLAFVTERNSRKYENLKENPKLSATILFHGLPIVAKSINDGAGDAVIAEELWQVRLFDAYAEELADAQIAAMWAEESLHAKIRSHICECGKPLDYDDLKRRHDKLLQDGENKLQQTKTYTAFKINANRWDFYKSQDYKIADRVQYRKKSDNTWEINHVAA